MHTTFRHGAHISLAAAALVGLLAVLPSPGRNSAAGPSRLASATPSERNGTAVRIELVAGDQIATAVLDDTPEARAFAALLPITVEMEDRFWFTSAACGPGCGPSPQQATTSQ